MHLARVCHVQLSTASSSRHRSISRFNRFVWIQVVFASLSVFVRSDEATAQCTSLLSSGTRAGDTKSHSLLQFKSRLGQSSTLFQDQLSDSVVPENQLRGEINSLLPSARFNLQHSQPLTGIDSTVLLGGGVRPNSGDPQSLSAALRAEVVKSLQSAAESSEMAQHDFDADVTNAAQTAEAIQEAHRDSQAAQSAQTLEAEKAAEAGEALSGALQRVEQAEAVERQELAMKDVATRRLQEAARGAKQVQSLEDEGAVRDSRAAELLHEAIRKLGPSKDDEDTAAPVKDVLKALEEAQKAVAAQASNKMRATEMLQTSLEGAATAVDALRRGSEAQTSTWLRDALMNLESMHASWRQRTDAETQVAKQIEGAVKTASAAEQLSKEFADAQHDGEQSVAAYLHNVAQKVNAAHDLASQEAIVASLAQTPQASQAVGIGPVLSQPQPQAFVQNGGMEFQTSTYLQEILRRLQAMQTPGSAQPANQPQAFAQNIRPPSDVQQSQLIQLLQQMAAVGGQTAVPQVIMQAPPQIVPQGIAPQGMYLPAMPVR